MKYLGLMHYFLGLEVWQILEGIFLNQGKYVVEILKIFDMLDYKDMATPWTPRWVHMIAAKHVMRYLKGTVDFGLYYVRDHDYILYGYIDSYWERSATDRKSISGDVIVWDPP